MNRALMVIGSLGIGLSMLMSIIDNNWYALTGWTAALVILAMVGEEQNYNDNLWILLRTRTRRRNKRKVK